MSTSNRRLRAGDKVFVAPDVVCFFSTPGPYTVVWRRKQTVHVYLDANPEVMFWYDEHWFTRLPSKPVYASELPTDGYSLKLILERYKLLESMGLIKKHKK